MDPARRQAYLDAMGIRVWVRRDRPSAGQAQPDTAAGAAAEQVAEPPAGKRTGGSPATQLRAAMQPGAKPTVSLEPEAPAPRPAATPSPSSTTDVSTLGWDALAERVAGCRACELHQTRTQTVFGTGNPDAELMIVGEAPGADEDRQGEPFVGRAGQLLNAMLAAIGLRREQVYIANILKCRPPGNRNPGAEEALACRAFLDRQIALVQPKLILSLGAVSAHNLLATDLPVGKLRGSSHQLPSGVPVAVSYHPAYLLRKPHEKAKSWQDLQRVAQLLAG
jgi:DNA polymerase